MVPRMNCCGTFSRRFSRAVTEGALKPLRQSIKARANEVKKKNFLGDAI
jgi:hypothetical protein